MNAGGPAGPFDAVVVGAGPGGSTAALALARGGARVALVDPGHFPRDKACGDLLGPRALALLSRLGLTFPGGREVGEMVVLGPSGRRVVLPARAGLTYPGNGLAVTRRRFDQWLRDRAIEAGAVPITGRVADVDALPGPGPGPGSPGRRRVVEVTLAGGRQLTAATVIGADGATSRVAAAAGLVEPHSVLWGFAYRSYVAQEVERPVIALWDERGRGDGFPGYGWIFPGEDGQANVGLGVGLLGDRAGARRAVTGFEAFCRHLKARGLLATPTPTPGHGTGGWLKMGLVGTVAARGPVLLVGDAAGLVNPLQGEGIAPAMVSGHQAAEAVLADPATAARRYREALAGGPGRHALATAPLHVAAISGSPRRVSRLTRTLTSPALGPAIAAPWAVLWNDLVDGAPPDLTTRAARLALGLGRLAGSGTTVQRRLRHQLHTADPADPANPDNPAGPPTR